MKKFDYYLHLRKLNIREKLAISMVKQADDRTAQPDARQAIGAFRVWEETEEGHDFWADLCNGKGCTWI